jgi:copper chaperone CopZ
LRGDKKKLSELPATATKEQTTLAEANVTKAEVNVAKAEVNVAKAEVNVAEAKVNVAKAEFGVESQQYKDAYAAQQTLQKILDDLVNQNSSGTFLLFHVLSF